MKEREHLFLKKGLHHWGLPLTPPGTSWYWVHFNSVMDERIVYNSHSPMPELDCFFPDHYQYRFPVPKYGASPLHTYMESRLSFVMEDYRKRKEHGMAQTSIQIYQLFLELHQAITNRKLTRTGGKTDTIAERVMAYLLQHSDKEFDASTLSELLNLNYSYVSATFKKLTGQSIIEAHTKLRMNKASDLMRNSSLNVSEISERLGYQNPYYFSRVFKKVLGESPSSYMKQFY